METRPTAIFALNDRMALGIMDWALDNGVNIPQDISLVGYDDIPEANFYKLTTICQPSVEMGYEAVHLLFHLIEGTARRVGSSPPQF